MNKKNATPKNLKAPVVTILGHVDHGKTSILDNIRNSRRQEKEVGGITQGISVFTIEVSGSPITFVDTPGHEAFDIMRARGGEIADVVLLVVAANDGVKPQTLESIEIIKKSKATPILVINKVDLPDVDIEAVKRQVVNAGLLLEGLGGDVPVIEVSAKTGKGIKELLDLILLTYEVSVKSEEDDLQESGGVLGKAVVLESSKDPKRGNVSTIIVQSGTLKAGDFIAYQNKDNVLIERIKSFIDEDGKPIQQLNSGFGGKIIGLNNLLALGEYVYGLNKRDERIAQSLFPMEVTNPSSKEINESSDLENLEDFFGLADNESGKSLPIILKASSEGALLSLEKAISKLQVDDVKVDIKRSEVGQVTKNDIELAYTTKSIILAFAVDWNSEVEGLAKARKVVIRRYDLIYKLIEELSEALSLLAMPQDVEEEIGSGIVKKIFVLSDGSKVLGSVVNSGVFKKGRKCYIVRDDEILAEGKVIEMRHLKNEISEAQKNMEIGLKINANVDEVEEGDELHCFDKIR